MEGFRLSQFKADGITCIDALERLYERARILQYQLDDSHKPLQLLKGILQIAFQDKSFFENVSRLDTHDSPHSFHQNCRLAIQKHAQNRRKATSSFITTQPLELINTPYTTRKPNSSASKVMNSVSQALFSKSGRRYGVDNRKTNFTWRNPRDRDGKIKTCQACGSKGHFIRDCDKIRKPLQSIL